MPSSPGRAERTSPAVRFSRAVERPRTDPWSAWGAVQIMLAMNSPSAAEAAIMTTASAHCLRLALAVTAASRERSKWTRSPCEAADAGCCTR